jgi:GxxExxY protein
MEKFRHHDITSRIIGAAMRVHNVLGSGFQELVYQRALAKEFEKDSIPYAREVAVPIHYHGDVIGERRVDFLIINKICVEIKSIAHLESVHLAQAKNYIEAFRMDVGLLINFGAASLEFKRVERWEVVPPDSK